MKTPQHPITLSLRGRLTFALNRLGEKLWAKPLLLALVSLLAVGLAHLADRLAPGLLLPDITQDTLETLLRIISSSMLVIAVFAVGSMLSAYASAGTTATPRALALVVADDVSQYALSTFIGAFIFGIVALIALMNGLYGRTGRFALFLLTLAVFAVVVLSFVTWVDRLARLGRVTNTIGRVEAVAALALRDRARQPTLGARPLARSPAASPGAAPAQPVLAGSVGYLQRIDLGSLQLLAKANEAEIRVLRLPGAFITPTRVLAQVEAEAPLPPDQLQRIAQTFLIGNRRTFDDDPRFGLVVLSEIASRALSPAVNDPGTAIHVIGTVVRLVTDWAQTSLEESRSSASAPCFEHLWLPELALDDLLEDGFAATARDGAASLEVGLRLQKGLHQLSLLPLPELRRAAMLQAALALEHGEHALRLERERQRLRQAAGWVLPPSG